MITLKLRTWDSLVGRFSQITFAAVVVLVFAGTCQADEGELISSTVDANEIVGLVKVLRTESFYGAKESPQAMDRLVEIGKPAISDVLELLDEDAWLPRFRAVKVFALMGPNATEALPGLEAELQEEKLHFLLQTYIPLAQAAINEDSQVLIAFIEDEGNHKNPPHPRFAAELLGRMGENARAALPALVAYAPKDRSKPSVVLTAIQKIDSTAVAGLSGQERRFQNVDCDGKYTHHLQGICTDDDEAIFWSFTTQLVKTNAKGDVLKQLPVENHHGDLCYHEGKVYVAVNLGEFNHPAGNADSWIYIYDARDLKLLAKHEVQEVFHGAGGIGVSGDNFYVVGGLPEGIQENYVYEYDLQFQFIRKHILAGGHTHLGIQTATFFDGRWYFGCYGSPKILLVADAQLKLVGRHEFDCSLGIVGLSSGELLSASGSCDKETGCRGRARLAVYDRQQGLRFIEVPRAAAGTGN